MTTTSVGHFWLKMLLLIFKYSRFLLMIKRSPSLLATMFWMGFIIAVLASWKES